MMRRDQQNSDHGSGNMSIVDMDMNDFDAGSFGPSPVHQMFNGRSVFITGATGFLGRVLVEKLLRTYRGIKNIYVLLRPKKNLSPRERLDEHLFDVPIFESIKSMRDGGRHLLDKVIVISGDISKKNLGISESDLNMMLSDASLGIVIHSAAAVKFDEPIKNSIQLNLVATKAVIDLSRRFKDLVCLCHVSTAYVNGHIRDGRCIEEKVYPIKQEPMDVIKLTELLDEASLQQLKAELVGDRPNTYTFTKALAEQLIVNEASDLPVAIIRPSIGVAAWKEPVEGWVDNMNGPSGVIAGFIKGWVRCMFALRPVKADLIPVDVVANSVIAAGYYAHKSFQESKPNHSMDQARRDRSNNVNHATDSKEQMAMNVDSQNKDDKVKIFHCVSGDINPITWGQIENLIFPVCRNYPSAEVFRCPFALFKQWRWDDLMTRFLFHYLPALVLDTICFLTGKPQVFLATYEKLHRALDAFMHYLTTTYNFKSDNYRVLMDSLDERDKKELYLDIRELDWYRFIVSYVLGIRRYVLKEEDHTLPEARIRMRKAKIIELLIVTSVVMTILGGLTCLASHYGLIVFNCF